MSLFERLFGSNTKAKAMLRKLPIRDKASTIKEVEGWGIGDYGGVGLKQIEEVANNIVAPGIRSFHVLRQSDRIIISTTPALYTGTLQTVTTILRVAEEEFVIHTYHDTGGR